MGCNFFVCILNCLKDISFKSICATNCGRELEGEGERERERERDMQTERKRECFHYICSLVNEIA